MRMLRYFGLAVFVVCIAAFASGCGGGGGGGTADEEMPPPVMEMECPEGQVGTYPDCTEPGPTDEQRMAAARQELSSILTNAQARAGAASSAAAAIQTNADATPDQIADAISHSNAAQSALALIVSANTAATLATTPEQANTALANARAAQGTLNASASAISSIQGAVQAAANQRQQREADEAALTGGSSLIRHVRDNRKVYDDLLPLSATSIPDANLGTAVTANQATFSFYLNTDGTVGTVYPKPRDTDRGVLAVTITTTGGVVSSHSKTGKITAPGRLHQGLDLKNDAGTVFANAFTDISVDKPVTAISSGRELIPNDSETTAVDESRVYQADPDYLLAGIWLDDSGDAPSLQAFAYGSQPIEASDDFCSAADLTKTVKLGKTCGVTSGLGTVAGVLADNTDKSYTYRGNANGAYMADGKASYFKADVSLEADFQDVAGTGSGTIGGNVTNITAGGNRIDGSIELQKQDITVTSGQADLTAAFTDGTAAGVVGGNAYNGAWKGQFFGMRYDKKNTDPSVENESVTDPPTVDNPEKTQEISYTPGLPGSVAGTFYLNKLTGPGGDAAFIGAFGAHR